MKNSKLNSSAAGTKLFTSLRWCLSLLLLIAPCFAGAAEARQKINVMLLTGQCSQYHNWELSSRILKRHLDDAGIFQVDVVTAPKTGSDMSAFQPDFSRYHVVVMDYDGDEWAESTKNAFAGFVSEGGGFVSFHATDNAFPKWTEFNEMIGVGGWAGRDDSSGSKVRWRDGEVVLDDSTGTATHPSKHDFMIVNRAPTHPIMRDLPSQWLHANDELYSQLRGPAKNLQILATASADPDKHKNGTGENEPMLMAIQFGKGRVVHNTLGHVGPRDQEPIEAVNCVGFIALLQRSTEWAATGKVTLPVPSDFPTAESTSIR